MTSFRCVRGGVEVVQQHRYCASSLERDNAVAEDAQLVDSGDWQVGYPAGWKAHEVLDEGRGEHRTAVSTGRGRVWRGSARDAFPTSYG
ncbi:hypothetical protein [Lentzea sp. HUAS12]|uniref:hypothetical protein n=1 Tax=Lentzea sp. HUAS12 TaxID=2951806 RepID=UPI00209DEB4B|nr:hypothetical protein [Lentzea sp. HUAS12]USX56980.1 hypothetical protein ND450_08510 [Lentzea sp. HUAS12]